MQIVIDIPEDIYEHWRTMKSIISEYHNYKEYMSKVHAAIADGTPLPKGHGRLIDADALSDYVHYTEPTPLYPYISGALNNAPTIIEADKEEE